MFFKIIICTDLEAVGLYIQLYWHDFVTLELQFWFYIQAKSLRKSNLYRKSTYRVSLETWQLVVSFECLFPLTELDIKDFLQFIALKKMFTII